MDDTDDATLENVAPVYDLIESCGMRTTKTVWPCRWTGAPSHFAAAQTLEDPEYLAFTQRLQHRGFEIACHGATMESSERATTIEAHERFRTHFGAVPRVYANHAYNRENVYWGPARFDDPLIAAVFRWNSDRPDDHYLGHVEGSPFWWGDLCRQHHDYVRNLTFDELNVFKVNPSAPYHDPARPLVRWWFSATDAEDCGAFVRRFTRERVDRLEAEGGVCILATHLGKRYAPEGRLDPGARRVLEDLGRRNGWFVPVGTLLDWLLEQRRGDDRFPAHEWGRMQRRWMRDVVADKISRRLQSR